MRTFIVSGIAGSQCNCTSLFSRSCWVVLSVESGETTTSSRPDRDFRVQMRVLMEGEGEEGVMIQEGDSQKKASIL